MLRLPLSPPADSGIYSVDSSVSTASSFLKAQAEALTLLSDSFSTNSKVLEHFQYSLKLMAQVVLSGGKIVFAGMGKSFKIASKLVATLHSFGIDAILLHPTDALHGDVGAVRENDTVVMISASGNSPELTDLLKHLPDTTSTILLTCYEDSILGRLCTGLLVAPLHPDHKEQNIYGLAAPTVSTTLCLVLGDAVCLALYESVERDRKQRCANFARWHPGGAIGISNGLGSTTSTSASCQKVHIDSKDIPRLNSGLEECSEAELWKALALCPVVQVNNSFYRSQDIIEELKGNSDFLTLNGVYINDFTNKDMEICLNDDGHITGVVLPA